MEPDGFHRSPGIRMVPIPPLQPIVHRVLPIRSLLHPAPAHSPVTQSFLRSGPLFAFALAPALALALAGPLPTGALPSTDPEGVARSYLDAVEAMRWAEVVEGVHPEALSGFRTWFEVVLFPGVDPWAPPEAQPPEAAIPRAGVMDAVVGVATVEAYRALDDGQVLHRSLQALQAEAPGLVNAWVDRTTRVLGVVNEGEDLAHVVYRLEWRLEGAPSDREILTLRRDGDGDGDGDAGGAGAWRVLESRELDSLRPALGSILLRLEQGVPSG